MLTGCTQVTLQATSTIAPTGVLTPYLTITPSPQLPTVTIQVTIPVTPAPTPTPYLYTVKDKDTLLGIAIHFGIKLEDLQAANPTVDPHFMGKGLQLVIPIAEEIPAVVPTPTPVPVRMGQPHCYPAGDAGSWCIVAIQNDQEASLENLSVWMGLYNDNNENITSQVAYSQLNILRSGSTVPLMVYFAPPLPDEFRPQVELLSALPIPADDQRYIDSQVQLDGVDLTPDGSGAVVRGQVLLPENAPPLSQLWLLAVAYDAEGNIVGERKWKSAGETEFDFTVYSLAGAIDHVEVLSEARP